MTSYWFKPKRYGYGATPCSWQGWAVTIAGVLAVLAASLCVRLEANNPWALAALLTFDAIVLGVLVIVSYCKTDGEWRWRWGNR